MPPGLVEGSPGDGPAPPPLAGLPAATAQLLLAAGVEDVRDAPDAEILNVEAGRVHGYDV